MPVVPEPLTLATFKNLSAVTFPVGSISSYDWLCEWSGAEIFTAWLFWLQLRAIVPFSELPSPFTVSPGLPLVEIKSNLFFVIALSTTVVAGPTSFTLPNTKIKSMTSL